MLQLIKDLPYGRKVFPHMLEKIKRLPKLYIFLCIGMVVAVAAVVLVCVSSSNSDNARLADQGTGNNAPTEAIAVKPTALPTQKPTAAEKPTEATEASTETATMKVNISSEIINNNTNHNSQGADPQQPSADPQQQPAAEQTNPVVPTEAPTESTEQRLSRLISGSGYSLEQINAQGIGQLVVVNSFGTQADVYLFTNEDGNWVDNELKCSGFVGANGAGEKQGEGDSITPAGLYSIGDAFYIDAQPSTWLNMFKITENTYWVDDPDSVMYNKKVEGEENKDWESAEHMIDYADSYKFGFVINYNINPIVPGMGSAIFMHCGGGPTAGCVAVSEADMLLYLDNLNVSKNPYILIF